MDNQDFPHLELRNLMCWQDTFDNVTIATVRQWVATKDFRKIGMALTSPFFVQWKDITFDDFFSYLKHYLSPEEQSIFDKEVSQHCSSQASVRDFGKDSYRAYLDVFMFNLSFYTEDAKSHAFRAYPFVFSVKSPHGEITKIEVRPSFSQAPFSLVVHVNPYPRFLSQTITSEPVLLDDLKAFFYVIPLAKYRFSEPEREYMIFPMHRVYELLHPDLHSLISIAGM